MLLQRERAVVADRGSEAPHEVFGGQINDARTRTITDGFVGDRLQQVGLAEADRGMNVKRVEAHGVRRGLGNGLGSGESNAVRRAFNEGIEGVALVKRRADARTARLRFTHSWARRGGADNRQHRLDRRCYGCANGRLGSAAFLGSSFGRGRRGVASGRANDHLDLERERLFGLPQFFDLADVMVIDPGAEEGGRHRQADDALGGFRKLHAAEPA